MWAYIFVYRLACMEFWGRIDVVSGDRWLLDTNTKYRGKYVYTNRQTDSKNGISIDGVVEIRKFTK